MTCWQCGTTIVLRTAQKVLKGDTCPGCEADLHACRGCRHFDANSRGECREVLAEWVRQKDRNNYCDYFAVADAGASAPATSAKAEVEADLDRLFKKS